MIDERNKQEIIKKGEAETFCWLIIIFFYRYTVQSELHKVHSPTDAHLLKL